MSQKPAKKRARRIGAGMTKPMRLKFVMVVGVLVLCIGAILVQLFRIQVLEHDQWQKRAISQQLADVEVPANRGQIYDANMSVLALSREVYNIILDPSTLWKTETDNTKTKKDSYYTVLEQVPALLDVDAEKLTAQADDNDSRYKIVKSKVDKAVGDEFMEWVYENELGGSFYLVTDYKREYPLGNLLSCVMGFVGSDNTAREGLEKYYNEVLSGVSGRMVVSQNNQGDRLPTSLQYEYIVEAEDGDSLVLTVDQYIQQVAEKHLAEAIEQFGATNRGCAIVMDVDTGAVLAMAVKGDYDPNDYLTISDPTIAEQIAQLSGDEQAAALVAARQEQYRNKALEFYEPGSVFKTFTASMGMEEGLVKETDAFYCGNSITVADRNIRCWIHPNGHGKQTFVQAIANSCNPSFVTLSQRIGTKLFSKYYTGFGFTEKTGVDLLGEPTVSTALYYTADTITPVDVATSSIGQTFKVTPLQIVTAMCAVANGGNLMQPYVVDKVIDSDGNVVSKTEPVVRRQVISADTSARVAAMLENAVSSGSIANAYIPGYRVGGKTGTAEKTETRPEDETEESTVEVVASFGGFAPADDPQVAILVMVDEPQKLKSGGGVGAPTARKILEEILPYLGVEPNYTEEELASLDRSTPNVVGSTTAEAASALKSASLNYQIVGNGKTVVSQVPAAGITIPRNGTVYLYTDDSDVRTATVPDLEGRTLAQVKQDAKNAGINVVVTGIRTNGGVATATTQSVTPGTKVPKGTVITVDFTYEDHIY